MKKHKSKIRPRPPKDIEDQPLPETMLAQMRPAEEVVPDIVQAFRRGRPPKAESEKKQLVSLRLDADVLDAYRALGKGWQTEINETLRTNAPKSKRHRRGMRLPGTGQFVGVRTKPRQQRLKRATQGRHQ